MLFYCGFDFYTFKDAVGHLFTCIRLLFVLVKCLFVSLPLPPSFDLVGVHSKSKDIYPFFVAHTILETGLLILVML